MNKLSDTTEFLKHLPNKLTLARIGAVPLLLLLLPLDSRRVDVVCAVIFALAAITDYFDGYLARKYQNVSPLGALLDPVADKILVAGSLVMLAGVGRGLIFTIIAALMICRDIGISGIRLMALEQGHTIAVTELGKWKTFIQSIAIFCLIVNQPLFDLPFRTVGMLTLWASLALSLYSGWQYGVGYYQKSKTSLLGPS